MAVYNCNFTIPSGGSGGRLAGNGFTSTPNLGNGDQLQVIVRWGGSNPPTQINGYFIISPASTAAVNQQSPSPFLNGTNFQCYGSQTVGKAANAPTYTFAPLTYNGSYPGSYELTFVAEDTSGSTPSQWSEDPEFDTSS